MFRAFAQLVRPRLSGLVVATAGTGFLLACRGPVPGWRLLATLLGTALVAAGASAYNQWYEASADGRMRRTKGRPLPSRRISPWVALVFSAVAVASAGLLLFLLVGPLPAVLGLAGAGLYAFVYTPLKRVTSLCTPVGALTGAVPPALGFTAAGGGGGGALLLGALLFVWQVPHFLSLAWLHREDYRRGGFRLLPVADATGRATSGMVVLWSLALVPVSVAAGAVRPSGWLYPLGALALSLGLLLLGLRLWREPSRASARRLFLGSLAYLPLLLALLVLDPTEGILP